MASFGLKSHMYVNSIDVHFRRLQALEEMEMENRTDMEEQNNDLRTQISKLSSKNSK